MKVALLFRYLLLPGFLLLSCRTDKTPAVPYQTGIASWYGPGFQGRLCANGDVFDTGKLTAAHRTLPFGTVLVVTHLANRKTVEVRINDRGPFVAGRVIDLSSAAAQSIEMPGIAPVELRIKSKPVTRDLDLYGVQVTMLDNQEAAEQLRNKLQERFGTARVVVRDSDPRQWRIIAGREDTNEGAARLAEILQKEFADAAVVRLDPAL